VLQVLGASAAGHYATAFRVVDTLVMPLYALAYATYGKMFQKAAISLGECLAYSLKLLPLSLAMGGAVGVAALLGAGVLPLVFGQAYAELPWLVRLLAPMPVLLGAYMIAGDAMSATGRQMLRLVIVSVTLVASLLVLPWAMRMAGLEGAVLVRLASALLSTLAVWTLLPWGRQGMRPFSWRPFEGRR
jgi:O-antigen/teichoic acid export membrane protein